MATTTAQIISALDGAGYRLTRPRRALAALIADQRGHFTAQHLAGESRRRNLGVGRATVFRALDVLESIGAIERLDLPTGDHAFVACEPVHHHHIVCSSCGRTTDFPDQGIGRAAHEVARRTGYRLDAHRIELYGLCGACRGADTVRGVATG